MLYQPSNISPDAINGTGTVDISVDLSVSWQVTGTSAMTAYKITIYANDAASTQKYTTGKVTLLEPFWGVNYAGEVQYYTATITAASLSSAGLTNGNEYKFLITEWWSANDSVEQITPSLFLTRSSPSVALTTIGTVDTKAYSFTGTYSQAQGDGLKFIRWQIAEEDSADEPFYDTGNIYGTGEIRCDYDGFFTGQSYAVKLTVETVNGISATTGWVSFDVEYELSPSTGSVSACQRAQDCCVWLSWEYTETSDGYSIMRREGENGTLRKIADVGGTVGQIQDYSACSGKEYTYYVFPSGPYAYLSEPLVSETVSVQYWFWGIVEASYDGQNDAYSVERSYLFRYGSGGVNEGNFSNNNAPSVTKNFTRYPTRQGATTNYKTGSVSGYIGVVENGAYSDTLTESEAIFKLSTSNNALFLLTPKGHFLKIHTASAVTLSINHKTPIMPQTMTVSWVEVGSAENAKVILAPGGDFYPIDRVVFSSLELSPETGALLWNVPDSYGNTGSRLYVNANGALVQDDSGPFLSATMAMDAQTAIVTATIDSES